MYLLLLFFFLCCAQSTTAQIDYLQQPDSAFSYFDQGEAEYLQGNYQEAIPFFQKAVERYTANNRTATLVAASLHSLSLLHTNQKEKAYFSFIKAGELLLSKKIEEVGAFTSFNYCTSRYYWAYDQTEKALDLVQKIEQNLLANPTLPRAIEIEVHQFLGQLSRQKGALDKSIDYYQQAIVAASRLSPTARNQSQYRNDYWTVGKLYEQKKDYRQALQHYSIIKDKQAEILGNIPKENTELTYRLGSMQYQLKRYDVAKSHLQQALAAIQNHKHDKRKAAANALLASIYTQQKNFDNALTLNTEALQSWKKGLSREDLQHAFEAYLNQGVLFRKVDEQKTLEQYQAIADKDEQDWQKALAKKGVTPINQSPQQTSSVVGYNLGLISYEKAEALIQKFPAKERPRLSIKALMAKAKLYFDAKDFQQAKTHYREALALIESNYGDKHPLLSEASAQLAQCLLEEKEYKEALRLINQSINAALNDESMFDGEGVPDPNKVRFPFELLNAISARGMILYGMSAKEAEADLVEVLDNFQLAVKLLNKLRKTHRNEGQRFKLSAITHQFCQQAVVTCHTLYQLSEKKKYLETAFRYAELSKSAVLLETIRDLKARRLAGIPQKLIEQEHQIKVELSFLKDQLYYEWNSDRPDKKKITQLEQQVKEQQTQLKELLAKVEKQYPDYYKMKYDYSTPSIEELQAQLNPNDAFLEYMANDSFVYVLVITQEEVFSQYTPCRMPLSLTIKKLLHHIKKNEAAPYATTGHRLFELLLGDELLQKISDKKLIIAADAELSYIPFGVLPTSVPQAKDVKMYPLIPYLIRQFPISYSYSASLFIRSKASQAKPSSKKVAAWAPNFEQMRPVLQERGIVDDIEELPGAIAEAQGIAELFDGQAITAANATEQQFKQTASNYQVLHIATHGLLDDENPLFSSLLLNKSKEEDGLLHTYELFNMQLKADMAVLSACNSGVGQLRRGEGVVSIARGFAYAGVPNIVMSTWPVSDEATKVLMQAFYQNLQKGLPKDEALQQAKLHYLDKYQTKPFQVSPYFWGGIIIMGNNAPIPALIQQSSTYLYYIIGGVIFLLLLVGVGYALRDKIFG